jgi:hypothetical protein
MRFTEWDREDCATEGHVWWFRRRNAWTGIRKCRNCGARQVEDIEFEEGVA